MYFICDNLKTLSESIRFDTDIPTAVCLFLLFNPAVTSLNIYSDRYSQGNLSDFQYVCTMNSRALSKFKQKVTSDGSLIQRPIN